jgi:hypothetical protein
MTDDFDPIIAQAETVLIVFLIVIAMLFSIVVVAEGVHWLKCQRSPVEKLLRRRGFSR